MKRGIRSAFSFGVLSSFRWLVGRVRSSLSYGLVGLTYSFGRFCSSLIYGVILSEIVILSGISVEPGDFLLLNSDTGGTDFLLLEQGTTDKLKLNSSI
jgi:hypothetical protein